MKKLLVLLIAGSVSLASCSKDEIQDDLNHKEVKAEHLENSSWTVKHIKIHEANLDGKKLTDVEKSELEGFIKMTKEKLNLQKDNKLVFKYGDTDFKGKWTPILNKKDHWDVEFDGKPTPPFAVNGNLEIRKGRLYFSIEGLSYPIGGKNYVIEKIEFELMPNS